MFDRSRLTIQPVTERKTTYYPVRRFREPVSEDEQNFIDTLKADIEEKKKVIIGFGAHFIKNKCQHHLIKLFEKGYITHVVTNGASTIHDFEFAKFGQTEEDVRQGLAEGTFGLWDTGEFINKAINDYTSLGYGWALGKYIAEERDKEIIWPAACSSVSWHCWTRKIPLSICTSIGHDIIYEHPECDGAKIGEASYIDFLNVAETLEGIQDAVIICVGSAITFPMVMEKAFAMAKNVDPTTGDNCSCYIVDLLDVPDKWKEREPDKSDPTYYIRPMKTFNRMFPDRCMYKTMDNRKLMQWLTA
tara:strand:+ start:530 stop:1438 length:909 start_codon:yes stop_codon:yes gene_type:complete